MPLKMGEENPLADLPHAQAEPALKTRGPRSKAAFFRDAGAKTFRHKLDQCARSFQSRGFWRDQCGTHNGRFSGILQECNAARVLDPWNSLLAGQVWARACASSGAPVKDSVPPLRGGFHILHRQNRGAVLQSEAHVADGRIKPPPQPRCQATPRPGLRRASLANHLEMPQDVLAEAGLRRFTALGSL